MVEPRRFREGSCCPWNDSQRKKKQARLKPSARRLLNQPLNGSIGLALVGVEKGYRVVLCVPRGFGVEKMKLIEVLGGRD